jgi:hypothetical protein
MSPTSIAKVRLTPAAAIVRKVEIEGATEVEIEGAAAVGRAAAAVVVDAGGAAVEVAAADGTAVVMADTAAADDTRPDASLTHQHLGAATLVAALFFYGCAHRKLLRIYVGPQFRSGRRFDWGCEVGHNSRNAAPHCNQSKIEGVP